MEYVDGDTNNISTLTARRLDIQYVGPRIKTYEQAESAKWRAWRARVYVHSRAPRACVFMCLACLLLTCSRAWHSCVLTCLTYLRTRVFRVLSCLACLLVLCSYVLICLTCLLCSNDLRAFVLACFFDIVCPIFFTFEKLNFKNS